MGHKTPTIPSTLAPEERHEHRPTVNAKQETTRRTTMMTKTMTMALCACLAAMLLASPALANRNLLAGHEGHSDGDDHSHSDDMTMAMNDTMMNMTMNGTDEMANDTIAEAPEEGEEMPSSDDGRRKLLAGHEGHSDGDDHSDDMTMDAMNDTMTNMTMNGTDEMANDAIAEAPEEGEEMPSSDD